MSIESMATEAPRSAIRRCLEEALELLTDDGTSVAEACELIAEALDRAQALEVTVAARVGGERTVLAARRAEPVTEWLLIPYGDVEVERPLAGESFEFTPEHAETLVAWFDALGRKLAVDYEHQSIEQLNTRLDGLRPAAGWIGGLEARDDGLWVIDVVWTDRARELLSSGEYRYFSPVIYWADDTRTAPTALGPIALTNDPAMHSVAPLAASRGAELEFDETDELVLAQQELAETRREVDLLRRRLQGQEADAFIERGMRLGKIMDSTSMDWRDDYLRDADAAEARLSRAPVLLPPGRVVPLDGRGDTASRRAFDRNGEAYRRWGVDADDLEAFERAMLDGRVQLFGGAA